MLKLFWGSMPGRGFSFLSLPLGLTKPTVENFLPLISKSERRLVATSNFQSQAGTLKTTNAVLTSLPTFYLCTFKLHKIVRNHINKY
jgi:hypothetical protein